MSRDNFDKRCTNCNVSYNGLLFSNKKSNRLFIHTTWVNIKVIMMSERRDQKYSTHCMIIFIQKSRK